MDFNLVNLTIKAMECLQYTKASGLLIARFLIISKLFE